MHPVYSTILLVCTLGAIVAEVLTLLFPDRLLGMLDKDPDSIEMTPFRKLLAFLSAIYVLDIIFLLFSPDRIFTIYALVLLALSFILWLLRAQIRKWRLLMSLESAICLTLLLDVARTLIKRLA